MSMSRKDSNGRVLRKGESQRKNDGRYIYQYTDSTGKRRVVYSNDLLELREKEKELVRNQLDGLESYCSGKTTLNYAFDRYISTKYDLKEHTRVNYKYMYNRFVRDTFGKRIINDIKYSDVFSKPYKESTAQLYYNAVRFFDEIDEKKLCCIISELNISGDDLKNFGIVGKNIGIVLNKLLEDVISENCKNKREVLLKQALLYK